MSVIYSDLRFRLITNLQVFLIFLILLVYYFLFDLQFNFLPGFLFLIFGMFLFYFNLIGAGDIKLISILLIFLEKDQILLFFVLMSFIGAILAILIFLKSFKQKNKESVPYGVAIVFAFMILQLKF